MVLEPFAAAVMSVGADGVTVSTWVPAAAGGDTTAVSVENTHNFAGGAVLPLEGPAGAPAPADGVGCALHRTAPDLERARGHRHAAEEYGALTDALAVCLSKGLGAPVGSLFVGTRDQIDEARVLRKRMGGGMRQVGVLAAAGLHALDHHLERMAEDHEHARLIAEGAGSTRPRSDTNIVVVDVPSAPDLVVAAAEQGAGVGAVGPRRVRLLTHLDVTRADAQHAAKVLASLL